MTAEKNYNHWVYYIILLQCRGERGITRIDCKIMTTLDKKKQRYLNLCASITNSVNFDIGHHLQFLRCLSHKYSKRIADMNSLDKVGKSGASTLSANIVFHFHRRRTEPAVHIYYSRGLRLSLGALSDLCTSTWWFIYHCSNSVPRGPMDQLQVLVVVIVSMID